MHRYFLGFLFLIVISVWTPFCHGQNIQTADVRTIKAGDFAPGQLEAHYLKHGYQLGDITQEDYLQQARELLDGVPGKDILEKIRADGDVEHYRMSTGEFAVMTKSGRVRTYFKTDYGYWLRQ